MVSGDDFRKIEDEWDEDNLMNQDGFFKVKDVASFLDDTTGTYNFIQREATKMSKEGKDPTKEMGFFRLGGTMWVKMPKFAPWFQAFGKKPINKIPKNWDLKTFLEQKKGTFKLKDFGELLGDNHPLNTGFIRRQSLKLGPEQSAKVMGVRKDRFHGLVVMMPAFGKWFVQQLPKF